MQAEIKKFITALAKKQGNLLLKYFRQTLASGKLESIRASVKGITTRYDKIIDKAIISAISKKFPQHSILTEESGFINKNSKSEYTWIVDSLDGTVNFACGNPLFAICIALLNQGRLELGIIYAPAINEFYLAEKGKGAWLNGKKIRVSSTSELSKSYVYMCEGGEKNRQITGVLLQKIYLKVFDVRKLGSAGIEAAWVALGRGDAYITTSIEPWDVAPAVLLVQEAEGKVTDFQGNEWRARRSNLVFSNKKLHNKILALLER
jgi:myo-inositol-1(or 4)-monophosphatase